MAALNPKNNTETKLPLFIGKFQFSRKIENPFCEIKIPQKITNSTIEIKWKINITKATIALSEIPDIVRPRNKASSNKVAIFTLKKAKYDVSNACLLLQKLPQLPCMTV